MQSRGKDWFDFLIIGSGAAGSVLAARLSEDPDLRIGLIEAGGPASNPSIADPARWPALQGSEIDWGYRTRPQGGTANRVHDWPRGRVVGGSTAMNAMAHVRGHPSDFDAWAADGCHGWGYADLLPYFIRSETYTPGASAYHGDRGPLHLIRPVEPHPITLAYMRAGMEFGVPAIDDHNGPQIAGVTLNTLTIKNGKRQTTAEAYLNPAQGRPNLELLAETEVLSLVMQGMKCQGVRARWRQEQEIVELRAERGVILAAGTIGSPALLLRSGIGPGDELRAIDIPVKHDLPAVGKNLHDHLLSGGNVYRSRRAVPCSRYQHSESLMYIDAAGTGEFPSIVLACVVVPVITEQFAPLPLGEAYTLMFGFTHPRSRGTIRLLSSDPTTHPMIDPNYLSEAYDRGTYLESLEMAQSVGHARSLGEWRAEEALPGASVKTRSDRMGFLEKAAFTHHHPVGTCRMGHDPHAVVDPTLKVWGMEGLYVCDASIIPTITTGPTNAAVIALAERASDLLRGRTPLPPAPLPAARMLA
ncbi:MAG: GMC family oxidoreductase [Dongiaceae bacterium]